MRTSKAVLLISFSVLFGTAYASTITWNTPTQISGVGNVLTNGTLQEAYTFGTTGITNTTINGVVFSNFPATGTVVSQTVGNVTLSGTGNVDGGNGTYGSASAPYASLPAAYTSMLGSSSYEVNAPLVVTIAGLTIGTAYEVEFWVNDSRGAFGPGRTDTLSGTSNVVLAFNTGAEGGLGQYVVGTFVASAATQAFTVAGADSNTNHANYASQINGIEVLSTSTPEPSTLAMMGLGALALGVARFRRR
jgi:hypothetical protein